MSSSASSDAGPTEVGGTCDERFAEVRAAFEKGFTAGDELGASVCITLDGVPVVDLWGGRMGPGDPRPWRSDTLVNVYSITKTMTALVALVLVDRGVLDLDEPVARHWPEFAASGKREVLVRHLLGHTSGLAGWTDPIDAERLYDSRHASALLAAQEPWWEPGTRAGYHAMNFGHLVGELVLRTTGRSLGEYFRDEVAAPLGADFHIGTGPEHAHRIATLEAPPARVAGTTVRDPETIAHRTLTSPVVPVATVGTQAWRSAEIGAANGHGNARSVATVQSVLSGGGEARGVRLLSQATVRRVLEPQSDGIDLVLGMPVRWGLGLALGPVPAVPDLPDHDVCWWGGYGGSLVVNDLAHRMTFAYVMNRMTFGLVGSERANRLLAATYASVGRR